MSQPLAPARSLPADRPKAPSVPCAACGTLLDPLRTESVLAFEDGYRFLCDERCLAAHRDGTRARQAPTTHSSARAQATTPSGSPRAQLRELVGEPLPEPPKVPRELVWLGAISAAMGALFGAFTEHALATHLAALLCATSAGLALWMSAPLRGEQGTPMWLIGPVGAWLATLGAHTALTAGHGSRLSVLGAALGAGAVLARAALDRHAAAPVQSALTALVHELPSRAHVPVRDAADPLAMALDLVDVATLRTGEEIIARRGEVTAVDGVVQAGEARVLPFPRATTPIRRTTGDAVLAGARVVSGSLRLLSTRVGDERGLVRLSRIGTALDRTPSQLSRIAERSVELGPMAAAVLALALALAAPDLASALSIAGALLIATPVLALSRAVGTPLSAAAVTAGMRGIAFSSGRDLDVLGRASVVALQPHGVLTELRPVVVECHALDGGDVESLLSLCASAQRMAAPHPIALSVERFTAGRGITPAEVRRAVHHEGLGVTALSPDGEPFAIGSRRLLLREGISVAAADAEAARAETLGRVPIFIALGGRVRAVMTLQYELRVSARPAVQRLFDMGLEVVLLTGAHRGAVQELSTALDIEHIKADLLPEERGQQVRSLREAGGVAAVIGRPVDDDAALAAADAGIVLAGAGGSSSDRAAALVSDDVRDAAGALWIARAARDASTRGTATAAVAFCMTLGAAATSLLAPGVAALIAVAVDGYCLTLGPRLLRRIALRLPARN